jgi:hypothetical protein
MVGSSNSLIERRITMSNEYDAACVRVKYSKPFEVDEYVVIDKDVKGNRLSGRIIHLFGCYAVVELDTGFFSEHLIIGGNEENDRTFISMMICHLHNLTRG